jgi:two-component system cell cycle response regulator DivK
VTEHTGTADAADAPPLPGALVLIVDDNERNLRLARDVLEFAGLRTLVTATGLDGVRVAAESRPDVILMDIRLPDIDGPEALARLRAEPTTAAIPVVAVTSSAMMGDRERLLAAGFDGYLEKPINVREFAEQVRAFSRAARPEESPR